MNRVMVSTEQIAQRTKELGAQISKDYEGKNLLVICLLKGAMYFTADLTREITVPLKMDFLRASSYGSGKVTSGKVSVISDITVDIKGKDLLIVDDVLDSGVTLNFIMERFSEGGPASLKTCILLVKESAKARGLSADYEGFTIKDEYVIGYGMDVDEKYRNIPCVEVLED